MHPSRAATRTRDAVQTPPVAALAGGSRYQSFARKALAVIHLDPAGPRADRGLRFASFWPAGTAPANQNSPPPASQNSVSPGHPFFDGRPGKCGTGGESGDKMGRIFPARTFLHGASTDMPVDAP